ESHLIAFLVQAKERGLLSENNFKSKVYTEAASSLAIKGHNATSKQVKSRWTRVCIYLLIHIELYLNSPLRTLSGFGWDNVRHMVTATDSVWDAYLQGHPKARPFRRQPFPHYDDIASIIGQSTATGAFAL
ncbi:hypothetical protein K435DRAFT_631504, partial [Dendrothele bispora CBS 962.96]